MAICPLHGDYTTADCHACVARVEREIAARERQIFYAWFNAARLQHGFFICVTACEIAFQAWRTEREKART